MGWWPAASCADDVRLRVVELGIRELSALYLGGRSARTLARAELARADDDTTLRRFDAAMRWDPAPHSDATF